MKKNASIVLFLLLMCGILSAQGYQPTPNDSLHSVTIHKDNRITLRIYAPDADDVKVGGPDIPENIKNVPVTKSENGVWQVTIGPVEPGAYRYNFIIDKVQVMDPKNPVTSESNMNSWSLLYIPGNDFMDTKDVPHGAVSEVTYYSTSLKKFRRMHVYTPPGYENNAEKYPVFYLLHGAFDCDDSWTTVGRAGFIIDNLIAEKKSEPMVVVMPAGHTGPFTFGGPRPTVDEFLIDFRQDIRPYVEKNYRLLPGRENRAMAGLSMGGAHTLNLAIPDLAEYAYIGVFSSGIFSMTQNNNEPTFEEKNLSILNDAQLKDGLKVFWFATGVDDFLLRISRESVDMFKKHGFDVIYNETSGAHTWENWRKYLNEFVPLLFR